MQFALVLITHRCFTLKLQAARRNTDKICYDEGTMVLSTRISSLSALSSCLGAFKASGRLSNSYVSLCFALIFLYTGIRVFDMRLIQNFKKS